MAYSSEEPNYDPTTLESRAFKWWHLLLLFILNVALFQLGGIVIILAFGEFLTYSNLSIITLLLSFLTNFGLFWIFGIKTEKLTWTEVGLKPFNLGGWKYPILAILTTILIFIFRLLLGVILALLFPPEVDDSAINVITAGGNFWFGLLISSLGIPIVEELFYRGLIYKGLRQRYNIWLAILVSSLFFGIAHLDLIQGILAFVMGLFLALLYEKSNSLYIPILMHILNNLISFLLTWFLMG